MKGKDVFLLPGNKNARFCDRNDETNKASKYLIILQRFISI
jgi:hypothetical protein